METDHENINYGVSAPGKVILFGEHSVVYKKAALSTAIGKRLHVLVQSINTKNFIVKLPQINTEAIWDLELLKQVAMEKCPMQDLYPTLTLENPFLINYNAYINSLKHNLEQLNSNTNDLVEKSKAALIGILFILRGMFNGMSDRLVPISLEIKSELEVGAGTGSSAAFSVAIAGSIFHLTRILLINKNTESTLSETNINSDTLLNTKTSGFSSEEMSIINKWAFCIERIMHGHPSGIDNTTCTFGSIVLTSQEKENNGELVFSFLENVPKISILLISTGVSRNTSSLVSKVSQLRNNNTAVIDAILNAMDVIAQEAVKTLKGLAAPSFDAKEKDRFYNVLSGLIELNHGLLRTLGVSHERLERIVSVSNNYGLSSKLTGAGGGGYAITLVPPYISKEKIEALKTDLGPSFKVIEINIAEEGIKFEKPQHCKFSNKLVKLGTVT